MHNAQVDCLAKGNVEVHMYSTQGTFKHQ